MPVAETLPPQQGWYLDNTARGGADNIVGHQQARQQEDTNLAGSVRQSIYTKTGTPVRQVGRLGPGVTVPEK